MWDLVEAILGGLAVAVQSQPTAKPEAKPTPGVGFPIFAAVAATILAYAGIFAESIWLKLAALAMAAFMALIAGAGFTAIFRERRNRPGFPVVLRPPDEPKT